MNRQAVYANIPTSQSWHGLNKQAQKEAVEAAIDSFVSELEQVGAEPDEWEATDLGAALNAVFAGWYTLAITYVCRGLEPPESRAQEWHRNEETPDIRKLRDALAYVRGAPTR